MRDMLTDSRALLGSIAGAERAGVRRARARIGARARTSPIVCFVLALILSLCRVAAAQAPQSPALSPEYVKWQERIAFKQIRGIDTQEYADSHGLGEIPEPFDWSHLKQMPARTVLSDLGVDGHPASYDLRALGHVTPVKDQGSCGSCWTFGTYGSLESWLLKNTGETWDFSENHLKNHHGFDLAPCEGGNPSMSIAYMSRWDGPVDEADDPYSPTDDRPSPGGAFQKHVRSMVYLTTSDQVKDALMADGALYASMRYVSTSYNLSDYTYYYSGTEGTNHGVTLVGWDDNKAVSGAPGAGAWIIKNSWGDTWGDNGYFYISYYDSKILSRVRGFRDAVSVSQYDDVYQYDPLGQVSALGWGVTTAWGANIFTATANHYLVAVGLHALANNTSYRIFVYDDFNGSSFSNLLGSTTGSVALAGYHTVALPAPIALTSGDRFGIVVEFTTPGYNYPVPTERIVDGYSSAASANSGESYASSNGAAFADITTWGGTFAEANVCIKGLVVTDPTPPTVSVVNVSGALSVDVTFSEAMGSGVLDAANYTLSGSGKGTLADNPDSVSLVSGATYRLAWGSGEMVNGGDIAIVVQDVEDANGNPIGTPSSGLDAGGGIGVPPTVTTVEVQTGRSVAVTFSEEMGAGVTTPANYTVSGGGQGTLAAHPDRVACQGGDTYRLTWYTGEMLYNGDITITVQNAADVAGNAIGSPNSGTDAGAGMVATPLDDFVAAPDPNLSFSLHGQFSGVAPVTGEGYTAYIYYMTSQEWRLPSEVDRTLWEHWLTVIVPDNVTNHSKAMLYIGGKNNGTLPPDPTALGYLHDIATYTDSIVAELRMVPNQPLRFPDETDPRYTTFGRTEDELIAYTWDKFRTTGDSTWLGHLPMAKSAVRAMDVMQTLHSSIEGFVVSGGSKRGWTTWLTAIADGRVKAIIPIVIDLLNVEVSFRHHHDVYGFWAPAVQDYVDMDLMTWMHTPAFRSLLSIQDPYQYTDRLTLPKYVMNSTGDPFFLPDSSQYYWDALKGQKHLRYVPNTDHAVYRDQEGMYNLAMYYKAILEDTTLPEYSWTKQPDGSLRVQTSATPSQVLLWQASNPTARDFRRDVIGSAWTSTPLASVEPGVYVGQVPTPANGYTAFMVELTYPGDGVLPFKFTTDVSVLPQIVEHREVGGSGTIETVGSGTDEITLVKLSGDRYQMGYWYGRLLADQISGIWANISAAGVPEEQYDEAIDAMWRNAYFDTQMWEQEMRGIEDGCLDAGYPEITFRVLQKIQCIGDISEYNCSLFAAWGNATSDGGMYQMRNLDWTMDSGFQDYPVVAMYYPDDGYPHAIIGFAGLLGAGGGGINAHGLACSEIMGYFCDAETLNGIPFPVLLRDVLYHDATLADALARMDNATRTNQYHYCIADPDAPGSKARLLFTSNTRFDQYQDNESVTVHPCVSPAPFHAPLDDVVYWKNHNGSGNELLYNALNSRYGLIDDAKAIEVARAAGVNGTLLSIIYHNTGKDFWVAFADGQDPAHNQGYVHFQLEDQYTVPTVWVDFGYSGDEIGTENLPYNSLAEAIARVAVGGEIFIKGGVSSETLEISKDVTIHAVGGEVTVGGT